VRVFYRHNDVEQEPIINPDLAKLFFVRCARPTIETPKHDLIKFYNKEKFQSILKRVIDSPNSNWILIGSTLPTLINSNWTELNRESHLNCCYIGDNEQENNQRREFDSISCCTFKSLTFTTPEIQVMGESTTMDYIFYYREKYYESIFHKYKFFAMTSYNCDSHVNVVNGHNIQKPRIVKEEEKNIKEEEERQEQQYRQERQEQQEEKKEKKEKKPINELTKIHLAREFGVKRLMDKSAWLSVFTHGAIIKPYKKDYVLPRLKHNFLALSSSLCHQFNQRLVFSMEDIWIPDQNRFFFSMNKVAHFELDHSSANIKPGEVQKFFYCVDAFDLESIYVFSVSHYVSHYAV
jgi:hypothetical protein